MRNLIAAALFISTAGCTPVPVTSGPQVQAGQARRDSFQDFDQDPIPVTAPPPVYPEFAKDAAIEGRVELHVLVGEDGTVQDIEVIQGVTGLTESAVDTVRKWIFKPALKGGYPVAAWITEPIDFHIEGLEAR
jgi:protein TonB